MQIELLSVLIAPVAATTSSKFPLHTVLQVMVVIDAVLLILGVLLQTPRTTGGLGGTIGGGGDSGGGYRTRRGVEKSLFQVTVGLTVLFVALSVANIKLGWPPRGGAGRHHLRWPRWRWWWCSSPPVFSPSIASPSCSRSVAVGLTRRWLSTGR